MKKALKKDDDNPLVSVIVPAYNRASYLKPAIESILNQTYKNIEIIVVDDGSTDETKDVIKEFKDQVQYIYQTNQGNAAARNAGVQKSRGEYLGFLDSDDLWFNTKVARQVEFLREHHDCSFVYTGAQLIDEEGNNRESRLLQKGEEMTFDCLYKRNIIISTSIVMVRKNAMDEVGGFDEDLRQSVDYDLWLRLSKRHKFDCINEPLALYRVHETNISSNLRGRKKAHLRIFKKKEILGDKSWYQRYLRIAQVYFYTAQLYHQEKDYLKAAIHFFLALGRVPWIGRYYWLNEFQHKMYPSLYRILKAYKTAAMDVLRHFKHRNSVIKRTSFLSIEANPQRVQYQEPYFYVKKVKGITIVRGQKHYLLGHKIAVSQKDDDGVFVQWNWDGKLLRIKSDRYGFYPCYYFEKENEFAISPSIDTLIQLGAGTDFDYNALAVFLRIGFYLGNSTAFKNIKALSPDARYEWSNGRLNKEGGYTPSKWIKTSSDEAIDQYQSLFRLSMKKRLPSDDNFVVPLSGGRDSRHILLECDALGIRPKFCVTYEQFPNKPCDDVDIAKRIAQSVNVKHVLLTQDNSRFKSEFLKNRITQYCSDEHTQSLILANYLKGKTDIIFDGIAGDTLSEGKLKKQYYNNFYRTNNYQQLAVEIIKYWGFGEEALLPLVSESFYKKIPLESALEEIKKELAQHVNDPDPLSSFYFWNRTRREIALNPYRIFKDLPCAYSPFLDYELVEFLRSLRMEVTEGKQIHTDLIARYYPKYKDIGYGKRTEPTQTANIQEFSFARDFAGHCSRRLKFQSGIVNTNFLLPKALKLLTQSGPLDALFGLQSRPALYLLQLEDLINN